MKVINNTIQEMMTYCNDDPLSTKGNKSSLQIYKIITLKDQFIDSMIDMYALHYLSQWKGVDPLAEFLAPTMVGPPQGADVTNDQMIHINTILAVEELAEEQKCTSIKEHFK